MLEALATAQDVAGGEPAHALGLCAGGIVLAAAAAHLAARGEADRLAGLTLGVCVLGNARTGTTSAFLDRRLAALAVAKAARRGYLDGRALAGVFAWLRPNDLIWNYSDQQRPAGARVLPRSTCSTGTRTRRTYRRRCTAISCSFRLTTRSFIRPR